MKRLYQFFLLLLALLPATATAYDFEVDGIYYNIINETEAAVTYKSQYFGSTPSYSGDITIPENVTYGNTTYSVSSIGLGAFYGCHQLTSISIPNSVSTIGNWVFKDCIALTSIDIPNAVTHIGTGTFYGCSGLTNFDISNSVKSIDCDAFGKCYGLTSITIPNSVSYISEYSFNNCSRLASIIVDSGNSVYDSRCNSNAIIETASNTLIVGCLNTVIPNTVTSIGVGAFMGCSRLNSVIIPNTINSIKKDAFYQCSGLTSVTIPNSVTAIGYEAFAECSNLTSVTIPNSVTSIGTHAFYNCSRISSLIITGEGEWKGLSLSSTIQTFPTLFIDSRISDIKGMSAPHSNIYCYATTPPLCDGNSFTNYNGTLHVPAASLAAYFTAEYWCEFSDIIGDAVEPNDIVISRDSIEMNISDQFNLTATVFPSNATPNNIIWLSTNPSIATVSNGMVSALGLGECDIIAQCLNKQAICHVVVNDTTVTITLDQQEAMVLPNHIITITPSASPIMPNLSVTSSDPSVAAARVVNNKVQVVGIKEGTTTITVGSADGTAIPATCLVTVYTEPGDLNCDGFVTISDVTSLIDYLLGGDETSITTKNADVNGDGNISISDVTSIIDTLLSGN